MCKVSVGSGGLMRCVTNSRPQTAGRPGYISNTSITLRAVETDADYEAWCQVRLAVVPAERCDAVAELRHDAAPSRPLVLAERDGVVVGSGTADQAESKGNGFVALRVLPELRRQGIGTAILAGLIDHVAALDLPQVRANAEDPAAVAFAEARLPEATDPPLGRR